MCREGRILRETYDKLVATLVGLTVCRGSSGTLVDEDPSGSAAPAEAASASQEDSSGLSVSQQPLGQMATAAASQVTALQQKLDDANKQIKKLESMQTFGIFGEEFRKLMQQDAADYTERPSRISSASSRLPGRA